jgi:hypothetical protein
MHYWMLKISARSFSSYLPRYRIIHTLNVEAFHTVRMQDSMMHWSACAGLVGTLGSAYGVEYIEAHASS